MRNKSADSNFKKFRKTKVFSGRSLGSDMQEYLTFFENFAKQVTAPQKSNAKYKLKIERDIPGLNNLFQSMSASALDGAKGEWNPISQKIFDGHIPKAQNDIAHDFDQISITVTQFLIKAHEALHIYFWEPFFSGQYRIRSKEKFVEQSLVFEGCCFWYTDILMTPPMRAYLPDGEFVFSRTAVSQRAFHPYRAFKSLGIDDQYKILDLYIDSFRGYETPIFSKRVDGFVHNLAKRIYGFYVGSIKPSTDLFNRLKAVGIFSEFFDRFCDIPNLPSAIDDSTSKLLADGKIEDYCRNVFKSSLPQLQKLDSKTVFKVRVRRHLQLRAYTAMSLRFAVEKQLVFSVKNLSFDSKKIIHALNDYIDQIEVLIKELACGGDPKGILSSCATADKFYSKNIRTIFLDKQLWMAERGYYFPVAKKLKSAHFGKVGNEADFTEISGRLEYLMAKYYAPFFDNRRELIESEQLAAVKCGEIYRDMTTGRFNSETALAKLRKKFNEVVVAPGILEQWSVPLSLTNPEENFFNEVLFVYE